MVAVAVMAFTVAACSGGDGKDESPQKKDARALANGLIAVIDEFEFNDSTMTIDSLKAKLAATRASFEQFYKETRGQGALDTLNMEYESTKQQARVDSALDVKKEKLKKE